MTNTLNCRIKTESRLVVSFIFAILIFVTIALKTIIQFDDVRACFTFYGIYAFFVYLLIIVLTVKANKKATLFHVFLPLTFVFYFGGQLLVSIGYYEELSTRIFSVIDDRVPLESKIEAMSFILVCILLISIGYVLVINKQNKHKKLSIISNLDQSNNLYRLGLILLFITVVPTLISLMRNVFMSVSYGHLGYREEKAEETGIWFLFSYLAGWFKPACYMIAIAKKNDKKRFIGYFCLIVYSILYLMSGSRYQVIEIVFCVLAIRFIWNHRKINVKTTIKWLLALFLFGVLLKVIGYAREQSTGLNIFDAKMFQQVFKENIIYQVLSTTSTTFTTISNIIYRCPSEIPFNNCQGYLGAFFYTLPSFLRPNWMASLNVDVEKVFSPLYYNWTTSGYGSSFLAEMYFNLGYFSYIGCFVFGLFLGLIINKTNESARRNNSFAFFACVFLLSELIWGIRSDLFLIPRHMVLYVLIPAIVLKLFFKQRTGIYYCSKQNQAFTK